MRYGFDKQGGFAAVDDSDQVAYYAYPTSISAQAARKSGYHAEQIATRGLANERVWAKMLRPEAVADKYNACCRHLAPLPV